MRLFPPLTVLALLAACGTPQEQCITRETRDLRILNRLISETEGNLKRGYALEEVTIYREEWAWCQPPVAAGTGSNARPADTVVAPPTPVMCLQDRASTETRPKAIDLRAEAAKLASQKAKQAELSRAAERSIAQCRSAYPE